MNSQQVNFTVHDLATAIRFYSAMFASAPAVLKPDCAKWVLNDPRVSFTIFAPDARHPGLAGCCRARNARPQQKASKLDFFHS